MGGACVLHVTGVIQTHVLTRRSWISLGLQHKQRAHGLLLCTLHRLLTGHESLILGSLLLTWDMVMVDSKMSACNLRENTILIRKGAP